MFHKVIYLLGQNFRNPSLKKKYNFLKNSENWSLEELEKYQLKKLKELLKIAYNTTYYKRKFDELGIDINKISNIDDINRFPIITKEELIKYNYEIHSDLKFKKKFKAITSGTSGQSLKFFREESADSFNRAAIQRGYSWYKVNPWDRNGYFWGFNFSFLKKMKTNFLDTLQNRFRVFSYEEKTFQKFVRKCSSAVYIHGYSSMIYQTAVLINKLSLPKPKQLKMIKGTSEKLYESYQEEIKKAFGVKMISEYGATESGIIAFECKEGNMHINMEGVLVEEINNEILVTNLQMQSFPIIRYKLGDYISLASRNKKCPCLKQHLIIEEITGRVGENFFGKEHIYPSLTFYYIFKNISQVYNKKLVYQVLQNTKGFLIFNIEQNLDELTKSYVEKEIKKYFKNDIEYKIYDNMNLKSNGRKMKEYISNVNE